MLDAQGKNASFSSQPNRRYRLSIPKPSPHKWEDSQNKARPASRLPRQLTTTKRGCAAISWPQTPFSPGALASSARA